MFLFGFFPNVLVLYLIYYNLLALVFACLGKRVKNPMRVLWWLVLVACFCSACFTLLDDIITPLWYSYSPKAARAYFIASLSVMIPQVICTAVSMAFLFLPLRKVFVLVKRWKIFCFCFCERIPKNLERITWKSFIKRLQLCIKFATIVIRIDRRFLVWPTSKQKLC